MWTIVESLQVRGTLRSTTAVRTAVWTSMLLCVCVIVYLYADNPYFRTARKHVEEVPVLPQEEFVYSDTILV